MPETTAATDASSTAPKLQRVLTLWDLILYGIVLIMPIAPVPLFGLAQKLSNGHAVTTILIAMVAMTLTASSYGRMSALYPSAGSAYAYVGNGLNPHLGFLAGWAMFLDYLLVPLICTIYGALTVFRLVPQVPYAVWAFLFAAAMTFINLRGIRSTSRFNTVLLSIMMVVVSAFLVFAVKFLFGTQGWHGLFAVQPFYSPSTFHLPAIATATSLAALTYGGFDGVSTLAEDVENPRRNVLLATVIVCIFTGIFGGLQVYLAQRVWPDFHTFANLETAFMDVSQRVGGPLLFHAFALILIVANLGSGLSAQAGLSRLLFGMGRDNVLPSGFFAHLDTKHKTPVYNIWFIGVLTFVGALILNYERTAELINFGAFLAFMGVNAATIRQYYFAPQPGYRRNFLTDVIVPLLGFLFCLGIFVSLPSSAKLLGAVWLGAGLIYLAVKTKGFRAAPKAYDLSGI
ncbi:MAG TPA: APC family permease [Terriglobales bacterium]|jgi:amino acid transporter|nr:APC family permease [Terriglobales bacterium]